MIPCVDLNKQPFVVFDLSAPPSFLVAPINMLSCVCVPTQMDFKAGLNAKLIRNSFTEAINILQEKGALFQKSKNPNDVYCVSIYAPIDC